MNDDEKQALLIDHGLREAELLRKLEQQTDWYQQRFNALRQWVNTEIRPLSEEAAYRYFAIVANGSPAPHEQADWRETMHGLTMRASMAERQRDSLVAVKERDYERRLNNLLGEVLAVLNGDGGHTTREFGWEESTKRALARYYNMLARAAGCVTYPCDCTYPRDGRPDWNCSTCNGLGTVAKTEVT